MEIIKKSLKILNYLFIRTNKLLFKFMIQTKIHDIHSSTEFSEENIKKKTITDNCMTSLYQFLLL